jgi:hypothetical protein
MHSNTGCFAYIKEIINGESYIELGGEEKKSLDDALASGLAEVTSKSKKTDTDNADEDKVES